MKDRLFTLALAIGAFAAFYALFAPKPAPPQERVTRPLTTEAGPNGYLGLQRWLAAGQVPTLSLRERYGRLGEVAGAASTGNLLISTAPHIYPIRTSEAGALSSWVAAGNTLLIVAGLSDTPDWSMGEGQDAELLEHMTTMTGLTFVNVRDDVPAPVETMAPPNTAANPDTPKPDDKAAEPEDVDQTRAALAGLKRLTEPQRSEVQPKGLHPLLDGVQSVLAISEYPSEQWRAVSSSMLIVELAQVGTSDVPALWLRPHGAGQIIVSAYGSIFTNKVLGEHDNAKLLANIVHWSLGPAGQVIVDDAHQGLVSFYDPEKFFGDSRLHRSLWWLLALWLVFVIGQQRLRPATSQWNPVDITSFVQATGGFIARVLKPAAAGQQLFANFFNEIRRRLGLPPDGTPVWDWIETYSAISARDLARLRELHQKVTAHRRVNLMELHGLLIGVRALLR